MERVEAGQLNVSGSVPEKRAPLLNALGFSLPDVIEDDWIENIEELDERIAEFIEKKKRANAFDIRYSDTVDPTGQPWEKCSQVLSRKDVVERLSRGW